MRIPLLMGLLIGLQGAACTSASTSRPPRASIHVLFYNPDGTTADQTFPYQGAPYISTAGGMVIPVHQAAYAPGLWIRWEQVWRVEQ